MIVIRRMREEDVEAVSKIEEETFSMPWSADAFLKMIQEENALYLVAFMDDTIVGSCGLRNIVGDGEITNVAVKAEFRKKSVGTGLMERLVEEGKKIGVKEYTLEVRESNLNAIHLYKKLGFAVEGKRKNFYEQPTENALIMWKR